MSEEKKCMRKTCDGRVKEEKRLVTKSALHIYFKCQKCGLMYDWVRPKEEVKKSGGLEDY